MVHLPVMGACLGLLVPDCQSSQEGLAWHTQVRMAQSAPPSAHVGDFPQDL